MVCGIYIIIMEDYILREIDKIGKLIEALLQKAGILRRSGAGEAVCETAWTELAEALDLDIDTLLACGITAIYRYLDEKKALVSLNRYYILKELENMTAR